jgi:hypothetical protein
MPHYRTFAFSCDYFGGYTVKLDMDLVNQKSDIIIYCVNRLEKTLKDLNLHSLLLELGRLKPRYHIHDDEFGTILVEDKEYYICNHGCHGKPEMSEITRNE